MELLTYLALLACVSFIASANASTLEPNEVTIVVLSQKEGYNAAHADYLRENIYEQADAMEKKLPHVVLSHELNIKGSWTIVPLLTHLSSEFSDVEWFFFCLENTVIRLEKLLNVLGKFNSSQDMWMGYTLYDREPTIIHHFAMHTKRFRYPHIASGFAMSVTLLKSLSKQVSEGKKPYADFSIDVSYEFATFVYSTGVKLSHVSKLCIVSASDCATYPRFFHSCSSSVAPENIYFAVKTCAKYHVDRVQVIKKLWAKYDLNIGYFSDAADRNLREAYIVPNTTEGHCAKTYAILQEASKILKKRNFDWLAIVDDDTIFSVVRLLNLLTCYNPKHPVAIGERYGFRMWDSHQGFQYLTGGAGVVLSAPLVHMIVEPGVCTCPYATTADDMYLFGLCLLRLGVESVHSLMFHQAQPVDYPYAYLASQEPISFHKFWSVDPIAMYTDWFAEADRILPLASTSKHTEL
ncbi:PREDICTED: beta-1,3-glucosyltransferase isoform X1 [Wasmannia auropunctata]|uniref:beta-1,3-glucosyltransferase isoform X1 n=2 Tax=Wasmannia auropunctata TaxID=64793 RepID=UPI0005F0C01E|nr:PREDICTED: beta-1,3-glucosyltransferase isoform X1 [Wasmannia auropunctata]